MTLFRTLVDLGDGLSSQTGLLDTISWKETLWLVPKWQRAKTEGHRQPVRIIRPILFQFVRHVLSQQGEDYSLACIIPKTVLDGLPSSEDAKMFDIVEAPAIEIPIPIRQ